MTQDGFLSLLALILAAIGFLPAARRLHLRATLRRSLLISAPAFAAVLYFEWYAAFQAPCPAILGPLCPSLIMTKQSSFGPQDSALAVVLVWAAIMTVIHQRNAIAPGSLVALRAMVGDLIQSRDHATLIDLVEPHLYLVDGAADRQLLRQRHYDWWARRRAPPMHDLPIILARPLQPPLPQRHPWIGKIEPKLSIARTWLRQASGLPGLLLPNGRTIEAAARAIRGQLLTDGGLRRYLVEHRPAFGTRMMVLPGYEAGDFAFKFLTDLAADTESAFYHEVERSGGADPWRRRAFDDDYPILGALLRDASVADAIHAYRPFAEHLISRLRAANDPEYVAALNLRPDRLWDEVGRYHDTASATITFFDLMVTAAVHQGVRSHMWLMYADHFVDAILKIHDETGPEVDSTAEWPTRGSEILYRIIAALVDWIEVIERLPAENWHLSVEDDLANDGNGRIPKSAIVSLARVTQAILLSPKVNESFKGYLMESVARCVRGLPSNGDKAIFRTLLVRAIAGEAAITRADAFVAAAWQSYNSIDYLLVADTPDLGAALKAALPRPLPVSPAVSQ